MLNVMSFSEFSKEITNREIKKTTCTIQSYQNQNDGFLLGPTTIGEGPGLVTDGNGLINSADLDYLINYLFINFNPEPVCKQLS